MEANVEIPASQTNQQPLQPSKPANNSHRLLHKNQHVEPATEQGKSSEDMDVILGVLFYLLVLSKASLIT